MKILYKSAGKNSPSVEENPLDLVQGGLLAINTPNHDDQLVQAIPNGKAAVSAQEGIFWKDPAPK